MATTKTAQHVRHGDVLLETVDGLPESAKKMGDVCQCKAFAPCAKHLVFAHGEVSGHVHQALGDLEFYEDEDGTLYAKNVGTVPAHVVQAHGLAELKDIEHLERCYVKEGLHAPIRDAVAPGVTVKVVFPREFNWASGEIERARD